MIERLPHSLFLLAVLLGIAGSLFGQTQAGIEGVVTDASGEAVTHASVSIRNTETTAERRLITDTSGRYSAPSLASGPYEVVIEKAGFETAARAGIALVVGQRAQENFSLVVGELKQIVTVEEQPDAVALSTQSTSGLVSEKQIKDLPLNGRSYDGLLNLNPGIVNYTSQKSGGTGTSNSAIGNMFSASGRRPQESIFLLNGIEFTSASQINLTPGGTSGQLLGVDAVREFNVVTDAYGAEFGKRPGAQVTVVSSSGTNQVHGSVYEFIRNSRLDARNFFDQKDVAPFKRNVFGVAGGGPIQRDKTFIFGNYEGFRQRLGLSDVTLVPNAASRAAAAPSVRPLLDLWPQANGRALGGGIAIALSSPVQRIREDFGTVRVDRVLSQSDTLSGIYTVDDSDAFTPSANPISSIVEGLREEVISLHETHVFSPRVLNTADVGFSRGSLFFNSEVQGSVKPWIAGAPLVGSIVIGGGTASNAATQISQAGANVAANTLAARNLFTYQDQVDVSIGRNHWQAGGWLQRIQANDLFAQAQYGQASFSSLDSFLAGTISTFTAVPTPTPLGWRSLEAAWFVQDTAKVTSHLELKIGFRAESTNGWSEVHGRAANYLFGPGGVIQSQPRVSDSAFTVNRAKFLPEPRFGLAWDPFGHGNTVVHAGFGISYALLDNLSYRLDQNAPFNTTISLGNIPVAGLQIVPGQALPSSSLVSPGGVQPDAYTPAVQSYTFKIEQKLWGNTALNVGYVGSRGYHEILSVDANQPVPTICPAAPCPANLAAGTVYYARNAPLANPSVANTTSWFTEGNSSYNALQVDVNHRSSKGLQFRGVYTFSKSLDNGGTLASAVGTNSPAFVMFPLNTKLDWGLSPFDVRQLGVLNGTYELPIGRRFTGWRGEMAQGWSVGGIVTLQSGFPFTPQLGFNPTNNGDSRNPIRPSWNPAFIGPVVLGGPERYFNPNAFVTPQNGTYGNVGRNVLTGPGLATVDFSILKSTAVTERAKLQFRAEVFNLLNRTNFSTPNPVVYTADGVPPSATAGVISATSTTSRQIQFGLKLLF